MNESNQIIFILKIKLYNLQVEGMKKYTFLIYCTKIQLSCFAKVNDIAVLKPGKTVDRNRLSLILYVTFIINYVLYYLLFEPYRRRLKCLQYN